MGTFGREAATQRTSRVFGAKVVGEVGVLGGALEGDVDAQRGPLTRRCPASAWRAGA
jgi:hypothetical protein